MSAVAGLASHQQGVVSRSQIRRLGLSDDQIDGWLRDGRLRPMFRGVYAVGSSPIGEHGRLRAALLVCGAEALVSHRSAAYLLKLGERSPRVIDVIARGKQGRAIDGIRVHDVPCPAPPEVVLVGGIACTSVARTIVDLAGTYGDTEMRETFERAAAKKLLDLPEIEAILDSGPRRRGAPCLRRVIDAWRPVADTAKHATVRSLFEAKLIPMVAAAGLPLPRFNAPVHTAERIVEVDLLWPDERFVVEADSRRHHGTAIAFERDRKRDRELMHVRYGVLRVTWREVEDEPEAVFAVVRGELQRRSA